MTTTFNMLVPGAAMEYLFDNATEFSVRFYENLTLKEDEEFDENKKYKYNIIIRHPEETNGKELFVKAISEFKAKSNVPTKRPDYLFIGTFPTCYLYGDMRKEKGGYYHEIGRIYYSPV